MHRQRKILPHMTADEARQRVIDGIDYAAYHENSLFDSDKNRFFRLGALHFWSAYLRAELLGGRRFRE